MAAMQQNETERETHLRELASKLLFSMENEGGRFHLYRDADVSRPVRHEGLTSKWKRYSARGSFAAPMVAELGMRRPRRALPCRHALWQTIAKRAPIARRQHHPSDCDPSRAPTRCGSFTFHEFTPQLGPLRARHQSSALRIPSADAIASALRDCRLSTSASSSGPEGTTS